MNPPQIETVPFGLLYPSLLLVAPDTATPWLDYVLAQATADLAIRTRALRATYYHDAQAHVSQYPVEAPAEYTVAFVEGVCVQGNTLSPVRGFQCDPDRDAPCTMNLPTRGFYWHEATKQVIINPAPECDGGSVQIEVSLIPPRTACNIPRLLYERYSQPIIDAALKRLMLSPSVKVNPRIMNLLDRQAERSERRAVSMSADMGVSGATPIDYQVSQAVV